MADEIIVVRFHEKGADRVLIEAARAYEPRKAMREFLTNSLDAKLEGAPGYVNVRLIPNERTVIVSDNGLGMSYDKLRTLPTSIGYSDKSGRVDQRGEKALGLLAFGSLGDQMQIITKDMKSGDRNYAYMRWEIKDGRIIAVPKLIDQSEVDSDFQGCFSHGTRLIFNRVGQDTIKKVLTMNNLSEWFGKLYAPELRSGNLNITLEKVERGKVKQLQIEPEEYDGTSIVDEKIAVPIRNEERPGNLEVVLFVNPKANSDKVAVYSRGVLVYESVAELDEFRRHPVWASGKVSGFVNDGFNRLILGRDGIDRQRNAFKAWYEKVEEIAEKIRPIVEESKKTGRQKQTNTQFQKVYDIIVDIWGELERTEEGELLKRDPEGELVNVTGISPSPGGHRQYGEGKKKPSDINKPHGPGAFKADPDGHQERVSPRRGIPFACPQPVDFPENEMHLRSKLEDWVGDSPMLYVNQLHEDYKAREEKTDGSFLRYLVEMVAKEGASFNVRRAQRENKLNGDPSEIVKAAMAEEEKIKFLAFKRAGLL